MPIVVCLPGGEDNLWDLPSSRFDREEPTVSGGMRNLLELAFAIASLDRDVELRGSLPRTAFEELTDATGVQPRTGMVSREFGSGDLVLLPEGLAPLSFARYVLSPARVVLMLLAPPGFIGWSMGRAWTPPDVLTVAVDSVGRPEHFRAMAALGFELWTQSSGLAEAARAAGVNCVDIGSGNPVPYPPREEKEFDLVYLEADKWAPLARQVVGGLSASVLALPWLPRDEVLSQISRGRIFVLPSRVEGHARILIEARAMGTVPVALDTNPFATGLSAEEGVALASTPEEIRTLIRELLSDTSRLEDLANRGLAVAPTLEDWDEYRTRIKAALDDLRPLPEPGREARAELGQALRQHMRGQLEALEEELISARSEAQLTRGRLEALEEELISTRSELTRSRDAAGETGHRIRMLDRERERLRKSLRDAQSQLALITHSRSWRLTAPLRILTSPIAKRRRKSQPSSRPSTMPDDVFAARHELLRRRAQELTRAWSLPETLEAPVVDVVIPVYSGLRETRDCLDSILSSHQNTRYELIVINDASPERSIRRYLEGLAAEGKLTLITNERNLGFVASANLGFALHPSRDVVLLNSDTEPANDWLDRLRAHARRSPQVSTVTPFSNRAQFCSYPRIRGAGPMPVGHTVQELDAIFRQVNTDVSVPIPAAHGFAMYITRACLDDIGFFDHVLWARGYGEESDFCARASRRGWIHLLACDVFVKHVGNVSFGAERARRQPDVLTRFLSLYPEFAQIRDNFLAEDPLREHRLRVDIARLNTSSRPVVLQVTDTDGSLSGRHVNTLARSLGSQAEFLRLAPDRSGSLVLTRLPSDERLNVTIEDASRLDMLIEALGQIGIARIHYHADPDLADALLELAHRLEIPYDVTLHDLTRVYPHHLLEGADRVFVPSAFVADQVLGSTPHAPVLIVPHSQLEDPAPEPTEAAVVTGETLRILTIGEPSVDRGLETLEAAALDAKRRELPLEFHFLGSSTHGVRVFPESSLHTYTPYDSEDLLRSIHRLDPHVYWFPWQEPGIYSYAMSTALAAALPVAATDVGDLRERLAGRRHSWVLDPGTGPEEWNDFFLRVRSGDQLEDLSVTRAGRSPESDFRYATDYVPTYEEASVAQTAPPAADPG